MSAADAAIEHRVLIRAVTQRDAAMAIEVLERSGIHGIGCASLSELVWEMRRGVGAVLLAEEATLDTGFGDFARALQAQPPWSDLPLTLLARPGADSPAVTQAMQLRTNLTVIERPLRVAALVSTLHSALRGRRRQYELRAILQGLETADERKNQFLATLAHELRNPLAPLSSGISVLRRGGLARSDLADQTLTMMERQVTHMTRLIGDLMQVSRITRGKIDLQREIVALDRLIADAVESCVPLIASKQHALHVVLPEERWPILADGVRLTQVFANLITNAAKYSPPGSRIDVALSRDGDQAVVSVRDDGDGIAPERRDDIFGMFVQVGDRSRSAQGGLGIGLTLAQSLVTLHGGTIGVHSEGLGRGSEFVVRLRLARDAEAPSLKRPQQLRDTVLCGEVLLVDDNRDAADTLAFLLQSMGATPQVAYDGPQALEIAARHQPSVAILDIGLPGMDGCELATLLRRDPRHDGMLLIALTGWGQSDDRDRILAAGFAHHLLKPLNLATLVEIVAPKLATTAAAKDLA